MTKATHQTDRRDVTEFELIPNIGPKIADQLRAIGLDKPMDLKGADPLKLYRQSIEKRGEFLDPCALDCYISAVDFMNGNPPKEWWNYTRERKEKYSEDVNSLR